MKALRSLLSLAPLMLMLMLSGCRHYTYACHKPQAYAQAPNVPPLKIPPGLNAPDTTSALHLPQLNEPAPPPRAGHEPCLDEPPPYKVTKPPQA